MLHPDPCITAAAVSSSDVPASLAFVSADTTNIALKGTGAVGRQEFSTLTFKALDASGMPMAGATIHFAFANPDPASTTQTTGGLTLLPASAVTDASGVVKTVVSAGTIPTSVRVVASADGSSPLVTTLSNVLVISTGVPDQRHFSMSASVGNCEGMNYDQFCTLITVQLGDHFGNPVPDGTAVNFTSEGGIIEASCYTGAQPPTTPTGQSTNSLLGSAAVPGTCSVTLRSGNPRPADGRVTVLAYALGEEDFIDSNGNNLYDLGEPFTDKKLDIFRDDVESGVWTFGEPCIGPNTNHDCNTPGNGQYDGVLRVPSSGAPQSVYVSGQLVITFSGSAPLIRVAPSNLTCTAGQSVGLQVTVTDPLGNLMPAGTTVEFAAAFAASSATLTPSSVKVPNVPLAIQKHPLPSDLTYATTLTCPSPLANPSGRFFVTVTTPNGVVTTTSAAIN
jgi:hypothetical protein